MNRDEKIRHIGTFLIGLIFGITLTLIIVLNIFKIPTIG